MKIEVLHIDECPNWVELGWRVARALEEIRAPHVEVVFRLLSTSADAAALPFCGSPTILVDGQDLFPASGTPSYLACRVYLTETGLAGLPSDDQLVAALREYI